MKLLAVILTVFALNSCNTLIGVGRDTKIGYDWTKSKIQNVGDGGSDTQEFDENYGAPVY